VPARRGGLGLFPLYFHFISISFLSKKNSILFEISLFEAYLVQVEKMQYDMFSGKILGEKIIKGFKTLVFGALGLLFFGYLTPDSHAQSVPKQLQKIQELQDRAAYDSARILANQLLSASELSTEERLKILITKQFSFYYLGQYDSLRAGLAALEKGIEEDNALYPELLTVRGLQKGEDALYVDAIGDFLEAEKLMLAAKDPEYLGMIYNSLAGNFKDLEDLPSAKAYYVKAKKAFEAQGDKRSVVMVYNNLGAIYRKVNLMDSALYVYGEASKLLVSLNNSFLLAQNTLNMGNVYEQKGELDQAEVAFLKCLELSESSKLQYGVLLSTLNLGNLYRLKKDFPRSKDWLNRALKLSNSMGLAREKGLVLERLSWLARDTNNFEEAYAQSVKAAAIQDSLASESVKKEVQALQKKFENEKSENEVLNLKTKNQQATLGLLAAGIGILLLITFILYVLYRQKRLLAQKLMAESERDVFSNAVQVKDMELTAQALQILQIKKRLDDQHAGLLDEEVGQDSSLSVKKETFELLQFELENRITEVNGDFFKCLLLAYPDLKPTELKLCSYLRLNLSTKELADVLNKSVRTVENTRFAIRKKMGLGPEDNLVAHLIAVEKK
jgi:tetratricopeptide (TPR) repeat protein/DNA-binding CsgD family transcriptional regulator